MRAGIKDVHSLSQEQLLVIFRKADVEEKGRCNLSVRKVQRHLLALCDGDEEKIMGLYRYLIFAGVHKANIVCAIKAHSPATRRFGHQYHEDQLAQIEADGFFVPVTSESAATTPNQTTQVTTDPVPSELAALKPPSTMPIFIEPVLSGAAR